MPAPGEVAVYLDKALPAFAGTAEIAIYGGSFTLLSRLRQREYLSVAATFVVQGRARGVRISTRPDAVTADDVALLVEGRVTTVELGCQSFSPRVLAASRRGHDATCVATTITLLRSAGMAVSLHLMPGLPGGDESEAMASLRSALALRPDFLRIHPTVVLRGTELAGMLVRGAFRPLSLETAVDWCATMLAECRRANVPVIRLGIQGTPGLDRGDDLLAGPYHPAFGQLVRSRLWQRTLLAAAATADSLRVHPFDFADLLGQRRANARLLDERFPGTRITLDADLPRDVLATPDGMHSIYAPFTENARTP